MSIIYAILVAVIFLRGAKKRGLSKAKWGWIGFLGAFFSSLAAPLALALIETWMEQVDLNAAIEFHRSLPAPATYMFPISAVVMFLVYRKWLWASRESEEAPTD